MKITIMFLAVLLVGCSDPKPFNQCAFQSEYARCFEATGKSYFNRGVGPTVYECRAAAMAVASYGE